MERRSAHRSVYKEFFFLYHESSVRAFRSFPHFSTWYDGFLYEKFIAPQSERLQTLLTIFAKRGDMALDIGCGVGVLTFKLAGKCSRVVGVDASRKMIAYAEKKRIAIGAGNVEFLCADAANLGTMKTGEFDLATLALFLHEVDGATRRAVIRRTLSLARKLVIADFSAPFPRTVEGRRLKTQEFIAGKRDYRDFKDWMNRGGIDGFLDSLELQVKKSISWDNGAGKVVVVASGPP
jgi:ubiquinone/menaquinone biosynthesis C-methylase UbiE